MDFKEYEKKVIENIERDGWHCTGVLSDGVSPPFAYTVGLFHTFGFPELIIVGLPHQTAHPLLSDIVDLLLKGELDFNVPSDKVIKHFPVFFVKVEKAFYDSHLRSAEWFYEGDEFPAYQMVWPSEDGLFPWSPKASKTYLEMQPLLGNKPAAN